MIELFFVTCLIADPKVCHDHSLLFEPKNGLFSCMLMGQSELARWVETHPRERVREWKCRYANAQQQEI
ncbi:hypothetical protein [Paracoccus laeviglucosivorans]|uniref:Uncharacterized protein n=1 Tax=Paracoccus laeviglucosivorans TaxID=1197861 RepID=A0A521CM45_9RHOB|nr:hypothetical protein [Paracoccus laeviglucosivorans]SMO60519.1 hypothetical protein SAMN06265221_10524 [Paracoccus laeviglucosivorans]